MFFRKPQTPTLIITQVKILHLSHTPGSWQSRIKTVACHVIVQRSNSVCQQISGVLDGSRNLRRPLKSYSSLQLHSPVLFWLRAAWNKLRKYSINPWSYGSSAYICLPYLNDACKIPSLILHFLMTKNIISYYLDDKKQKGLKHCHCSTGLVQVQADQEKVAISSNTFNKNSCQKGW